jgi:acetyl-CoA acyltransferase
MREAVIVAAVRTPVGRAKKGSLIHTRAEDLGRSVLQAVMELTPSVSKGDIDFRPLFQR